MYCNMFRVGEERNRQPARAGKESYIKSQWHFIHGKYGKVNFLNKKIVGMFVRRRP